MRDFLNSILTVASEDGLDLAGLVVGKDTAWSDSHVFYVQEYDGHEFVSYVPRNPD